MDRDAKVFEDMVLALTRDGHFGQAHAAAALSSVPYQERGQLTAPMRRLLEIADAVVEDDDDGVMTVDEDATFARALRVGAVK